MLVIEIAVPQDSSPILNELDELGFGAKVELLGDVLDQVQGSTPVGVASQILGPTNVLEPITFEIGVVLASRLHEWQQMFVDDGLAVLLLDKWPQIRVVYHRTQAHHDIGHQFFVPQRIHQDFYDLVVQVQSMLLPELEAPPFVHFAVCPVSAVHGEELDVYP